MKKAIAILFFFMLLGNAFATAQFPYYLIYKGEELPIFSNPLEAYLKTMDYPRHDEIFVSSCSACWRGYVATWKIEDGYLYLTKLVEGTCSSNAKEIPISIIFSKQKAPIKATWFSGTLRIPQGKQLRYVHMGYGSIYEKEIILTVENGKLTKENIIDNTKKRLPSELEGELEELQKIKK
jgi:hypothetical protein